MTHAHDGEDGSPTARGRTFAIGIGLNPRLCDPRRRVRLAAGLMALLADAFHNLSDVGGLLLAWAGLAAGRLAPNDRHTVWMATRLHPRELRQRRPAAGGHGVARVGGRASTGNSGRHRRLDRRSGRRNRRGGQCDDRRALFPGAEGRPEYPRRLSAYGGGRSVSAGVVAAGDVYLWRPGRWVDPVMSLIVARVVVAGTWSLFRDSLHFLFDGVPRGIDCT